VLWREYGDDPRGSSRDGAGGKPADSETVMKDLEKDAQGLSKRTNTDSRNISPSIYTLQQYTYNLDLSRYGYSLSSMCTLATWDVI
jgi:hypothetical protein